MPYTSDIALKAKITPRNLRGVLPITSAPELQLTTTSRAWKPYPPGNVRLNGLDYAAWPATTVGDVTLSWSHRNRVAQKAGGAIVAQDFAGSYACEGTLTMEALVGGVVKRTWAGLTGTSQIYTLAQRQADDADPARAVQFRLTPTAGVFSDTPRMTPAFQMG